MTTSLDNNNSRPARPLLRRGRVALAAVGVTGATLLSASSALALPSVNPQGLLSTVTRVPIAAPVTGLASGRLPVNPAGLPVVGQGGLQTCSTCVPVGTTLSLLKNDSSGRLPLP
ncbi:MAG: hypothetical protein J2O48_08100 [Solirubrobacterales bacterium]|nr:hypothetical protein [Solirubrobacterales bacterium]